MHFPTQLNVIKQVARRLEHFKVLRFGHGGFAMQLPHEGWIQKRGAGATRVEFYDPADFAGEAILRCPDDACGVE